jgi:hypothetical protein
VRRKAESLAMKSEAEAGASWSEAAMRQILAPAFPEIGEAEG